MHRPLIPFVIIAFILAGCVSLDLQGSKTLEEYRMPTDEPKPSALTQAAQSKIDARTPPSDCPVTVPVEPSFKAPEPYFADAPWGGFFWFGSDSLWTALRLDGVWERLPQNPEGYSQKIMWWSSLYSLPDELQPALVVTGQRLDAEAPALRFYGATNAFADDIGDAMLTGVDFPTLGCWQVTGQYKKAELTFVVWVAP